MSRWKTDRGIDSHLCQGELFVSASDMLGWIRACAESQTGYPTRPGLEKLGDLMASWMLEGTRQLVDGSEP